MEFGTSEGRTTWWLFHEVGISNRARVDDNGYETGEQGEEELMVYLVCD